MGIQVGHCDQRREARAEAHVSAICLVVFLHRSSVSFSLRREARAESPCYDNLFEVGVEFFNPLIALSLSCGLDVLERFPHPQPFSPLPMGEGLGRCPEHRTELVEVLVG